MSDLERDEARERRVALCSSPIDSAIARELVDLAHARALPGPVLVDGRDFKVEGWDELADCVNYSTWDHLYGGTLTETQVGAIVGHLAAAAAIIRSAQ